jgi:hypothetical protein
LEGEGIALTFIATVLEEAGHAPLEIVHIKIFSPVFKPVTVAPGELVGVATPAPETSVHTPVPTKGVFATSVVVEVAQIACGEPAEDAVGIASTFIATVLVEAGQVPFVIVHIKIFTPVFKPLTVAFAEFIGVTVPVLEITDQAPVPTIGLFAPNVVVVEQIVCGEPAAAVLGFALTFIATVEDEEGQAPFEIVHIKTFRPVFNPLTEALAELVGVTTPAPETTVHAPVPTKGIFAEKVVLDKQIF